jgi:uncharacterized membrane protein (DUF4010 family)
MLVGLVALLLVVSALIRTKFGNAGVLVAASAVASVELHAAAASLTQLAAQQALTLSFAGWGLVLLVLVAGVAKSALAFASGGPAYGWRIATGLLALPLAMALAMWLQSHNP